MIKILTIDIDKVISNSWPQFVSPCNHSLQKFLKSDSYVLNWFMLRCSMIWARDSYPENSALLLDNVDYVAKAIHEAVTKFQKSGQQ